MNLPYTMTPEMVADAAKAFKPKILYPYHTGDTDVTKLALALATLHGEFAGAEQVASMEEQALRDMIGTRRRGFTLKVGKQPKGWTAYIEEFSGQSVAQAPEARMAIAQSLDLLR